MAEFNEQILLFWDCPECGYSHIEGPKKRCPNCFYWRNATIDFYEAEDSRTLTPEEIAFYSFPDWVCKVCGASNRDTGQPIEELICGNCNSEQCNHLDLGNDKPLTLTEGEEVQKIQGEWEDGFNLNPQNDQKKSSPKSLKKPLIAGSAGVAIAGSSFFLWNVITPEILEAQVQQKHWQISVEIQEQRPINESGWTLPSNAYNVQRSTRQRSTRKVQDGYKTESVKVDYKEKTGTKEECTTKSNANGTATRSCRDVPVYTTKYRTESRQVPIYREEPVYDTWYQYTVKKWVKQTTINKKGIGAEIMQPPKVFLDNKPYPEKALNPEKKCLIDVSYSQKKKVINDTVIIPCDVYKNINKGENIELEKGLTGLQIKTI